MEFMVFYRKTVPISFRHVIMALINPYLFLFSAKEIFWLLFLYRTNNTHLYNPNAQNYFI